MPALGHHFVNEQHITLMSYANGTVLKRTNLDPDMQARYGFPYLSLGRIPFHSCLLQAAMTAGTVIEYGCILDSIDFDTSAVYLADGRVFEADLIIGSDGENSQCRSLLLGRPDPSFHFGHAVFSCIIPYSVLKSQPDSARFADDVGMTWWMGPGTMAIASIQGKDGGMDLMGGLIEPEDTPVQTRPLPVTKEAIKEALSGWDPTIARLVDMAGSCVKWTSTATPVLHQWAHPGGRFVLLGDAAHAMSPYLAQGASSALEDAAALGAILSQVTNREQIPEAIRVFHQVREPRCRTLKEVSLGMRDVYCLHDGPLQQERDHQLLNVDPVPGFIIPWLDPSFQGWVYGYDAAKEARRAWAERRR